MPYDEGNRTWKIRVLDRQGHSKGLLKLAQYEFEPTGEEILYWNDERRWTGKPKPRHFETLLQWQHSYGIQYYLLIHFGHDLTDDDYARELSAQEAAQWLVGEQYELPADLTEVDLSPCKIAPSSKELLAPLPPAQKEVWDLLDGRALSAKELARKVAGGPVTEDSIRKRVASIRKTGRMVESTWGLGYYRPDQPPPESTGAPSESG
jgi:hypothetical protein